VMLSGNVHTFRYEGDWRSWRAVFAVTHRNPQCTATRRAAGLCMQGSQVGGLRSYPRRFAFEAQVGLTRPACRLPVCLPACLYDGWPRAKAVAENSLCVTLQRLGSSSPIHFIMHRLAVGDQQLQSYGLRPYALCREFCQNAKPLSPINHNLAAESHKRIITLGCAYKSEL
jgi:hypothetical protein